MEWKRKGEREENKEVEEKQHKKWKRGWVKAGAEVFGACWGGMLEREFIRWWD